MAVIELRGLMPHHYPEVCNLDVGKGRFIEVGLEWPVLLRQLERIDGAGYRA